jgi:hypothetical protein
LRQAVKSFVGLIDTPALYFSAMPWPLEQLLKEWDVIKQAPLSFIIIFLLCMALAYFFMRYMYGETLSRKDELIAVYKERLGLKPDDKATPKASQGKVQTGEMTGAASASEVEQLKERIRELEQANSRLGEQLDADNRPQRREYLRAWRRMVADVGRKFRSDDKPRYESFTEILERQPDYMELKHHLSAETLSALNREKHDDTWRFAIGRLPDPTGPLFGKHYDPLVSMLLDDIARKAKEWGLD